MKLGIRLSLMFSTLSFICALNARSLSYQVDALSQLCSANSVSKSSFDYNVHSAKGPRNWYKISSCCNGRRQSPVHLKTSTTLCDQPYSLQYRQSRSTSVQAHMYHDGHTASVTFPKSGRLTLRNVPRRTGDIYLLSELHYHAGYTGGMGSEHWVDNIGYDGELHFVHYNRKYSSGKEATAKHDGLVVISVFIQRSDTSPNSELGRFVQYVSCLKKKDDKKTVTMRPLQLLPKNKEFFVYEGSQTTPPCSESVLWMVMKEPLKLSTSRLNALRNLIHKDGSILSTFTNIRPIQKLNYRLVETNFPCTNALETYNIQY